VPTGSVRISVGYMTKKSDLDAVYDMVVNCYVRKKISSLDRREVLTNFKVDVPTKSKLTPRVKRVLLQKICIYPIKSAAAFKINTQWPVTHKGLKYDRDWVIVNGNGVAVTQKHEQKLCLLRPEIDVNKNILRLSFPYMSDIEITCKESRIENSINTFTMCQTKVCGDRIQGYDCGDEVAEWLSDALRTNGLRLLRQSDDVKRIFKNGQQKASNGVAKQISLANQAQYLLINTQSVRWLANKVDDWGDVQYSDDFDLEGVVARFRGNLIIDTDLPLVESEWTGLKIGGIDFKVSVKKCK
jgi:molybdenum cofactor sulfurtransferase